MKHSLSAAEAALLATVVLAFAVACLGPNLAQHAHYHAFADQRAMWGLPCAMDVLSNLAFAVMGAWGLARMHVLPQGTQRTLAGVFFVGLLITAACSTRYHLRPDDAGLALDRLGMVFAFAGVTGLAVSDRLSMRAGVWMAIAVAVLGPVAVGVWANTANLLPWSILQGGGMLLVLSMAARRPIAGAWGVPLGALIAWYAVAKLLELGDQSVFTFTFGWLSGHSLKHVAAALSAWPVISLMHNGRHVRVGRAKVAHA